MTSFNTDKLLKRYYVDLSRSLRGLLRAGAAARPTSPPAGGKYRLWLRSLLAIYDIDEMDRLDLAWWQLDALAEVDRFLRQTPDAAVFEYGSGASTLWLARRAKSVVSVEHDGDWYAFLRKRVSGYPNIRLRLARASKRNGIDDPYLSEKPGAEELSFRDYVLTIEEEPGLFDLIIIDGRCRNRCLEVARTKLKRGGMIVFDNSNRQRYRPCIKASGLSCSRYWGLTACLPYPDETTLLRLAP